MLRPLLVAAALLASPLAVTPAAAQSNAIPGTDVSLGILSNFTYLNRQGTFPNGTNALAMATTSCNLGTVNVPWLEPMNENHPFIGFLVVREDGNGARMVQISDRSFVKHGFFALSNSQCTPCQVPSNGTFLGIGCSDTYSVANNGENFYLAPADEVNPWLGTWTAVCSFFDAGTNPQPGTQCDGQRSFTFSQAQGLGPVGNRVRILDSDLLPAPDRRFFYASHYVVRGEPEANRTNNIGSRQFTPNWTGLGWTVPTSGALQSGSVLSRWAGATVTSATNGGDDGRVYVGVKVTGPVNGLYHYEYAFHNRDNHRGVGSLRIPLCAGSQIQNIGFRDIDNNPVNDWTATIEGAELVLSGPSNPLRWNTIYNVWFDTTAAPTSGPVTLFAASHGAGAANFAVQTTVPGSAYAAVIGPGCGTREPAALWTDGVPTLGNSAFALAATGLPASAPVVLFGALGGTPTPLGGGCTGYLGLDPLTLVSAAADGLGNASLPLGVPNLPALNGAVFQLQVFSLNLGGPLFGLGELSDGLRVRFGALLPTCP